MASRLRPLVLTLTLAGQSARDYFVISVVDEATGRGVPLVELETTAKQRYYTDSNGMVALSDAGLMNRDVFLDVKSDGYEYPKVERQSRSQRLIARTSAEILGCVTSPSGPESKKR